MNSKVVFGQYYNSDSWLHRLDPRTKIISMFLIIVSLFLIEKLTGLLIAFGLTLILILSSRIPFSKFLASLKMVGMLLFITVIFQVILSKGTVAYSFPLQLNLVNSLIIVVLFVLYFLSKKIIRKFRFLLFLIIVAGGFLLQHYLKIGPLFVNYDLTVYQDGIFNSMIIIARIVSLIFISSLLTLTTKPTELNNGLEALAKPLKKLKINVSVMTMMISISLRFIPTLLNEAEKILKAQASRGVDFKESKFKDKITQIVSLLVPMFVISYKRAGDLADAMEARGYIPEATRTSINLLRFRFADALVLIMALLVIGGLIFLKASGLYAV